MSAPDDPGSSPDQAPADRRRSRRGLDRRTLAISVLVALIAAIGAGLVAAIVLDDGDETRASGNEPTGELVELGTIDTDRLLAVDLTKPDGTATTLDDYVGEQPLVVNLWAQSCVPCIEEMPLLERVSKDNPGLTFIGVNQLDRPDKAQAMVDQTGITYEWVRDQTGAFGVEAQTSYLPDTLLIGTDGRVLATKLGEFTSDQELQGWLDEHLPPG